MPFDSMIKLINKSRQEFSLFIFAFVITLFNTINLHQSTVLFLSLPQYLLVFYCLFNKDYRAAFLFHSVFIAACVSRGIFIEEEVSPFLYINMRVYGPLTFNIIILFILWVSVQNKSVFVSKKSLLLTVRKTILYLLVSGSIIGLIGCLIIKYYDWHYLVTRFLFVAQCFLFVDIFIRLYNESYSRLFATAVVCMIAAAPVASVISFSVFGVHSFYGFDLIPLYNPILTLTPCLIIALFQLENFKLKVISLIGLIFYVIHITILARGNQYLDIFVTLLLLGYLVYFKKSKNYQIKGLRLLLPFFIVVIIPFAVSSIVSGSDVSLMKFEQFTSLFNIFDFSGNQLALQFDDVGRSPYIRLAELSNIIYEGKQNIFQLFFGQGFGGFYTDSLHMFAGIDLTRGAFSDEIAAGGRFYNAHSAIPSVLQYNGLIGLALMLWLAFSYLRKVDGSFLVFAAFVLFVQTFYFDMFGCFSFIMALFGAEYLINGKSKEKAL